MGHDKRSAYPGLLRPASMGVASGLLFAVLALTAGYGEVRNSTGVAVIIGNRAYDHERVPEVSYAHRDAAAFKRYVVDVLGYDEANVIELLDASQAEVETVFGNERSHEGTLWRYLDPDFGSEVVVYYSGHGVPGLNDGRGYLLPRDADPNTAEINGYPIDLLYENLGKLAAARTVTVFLDACFSGDSHEGMLVRSASPVTVRAELPGAAAEKLTVLTAASGTQLASWDEEAEHGLFTNHLLDGLYGKGDQDGDGSVTAEEAVTYLRRHMTRAARRVYGRHQHATLNGMPGAVLVNAVAGVFPARPVLDPDPDSITDGGGGDTSVAGDEIQRDLSLLGMKEANAAGNHEQVLEHAAKLAKLGGELPPEAKFYQVEAYTHLGRNEEAIEILTGYLEQTGRDGERYEAALKQLLRLNERVAEDDAAYERARSVGTSLAYGQYLRQYPSGRHVAEVGRLREQAILKGRQPGAVFRDCEACPELVVVPAGSYMMGSPGSEEGRGDDEGPVHRVTIGEPFAVGVYEVTFAEWDACKSDGGCGELVRNDGGWGRGRRPVINVSWHDAQAYVWWLSGETGEEYRLLSESEWEYVARGGTTTPFHYGRTISTGEANYGNYRERTVAVGTFSANRFGLYDVHGNVWEWVADCWNGSYHGAPRDGSAWESGDCDRRVLRGGSWSYEPRNLRSANRYRNDSRDRFNGLGFRVARTLTS